MWGYLYSWINRFDFILLFSPKLVFVQRFVDRVEEIFINENKHHKFAEFLGILRSFSENQHKQNGADLYLVSLRA